MLWCMVFFCTTIYIKKFSININLASAILLRDFFRIYLLFKGVHIYHDGWKVASLEIIHLPVFCGIKFCWKRPDK